MKSIQNNAQNRVLNKLSAMRVTLSNDERSILDSLITRAANIESESISEVEAHMINSKATNKVTTKVNAADGDNEVEAHVMKGKVTQKAAGKVNAADGDNEVEAHVMKGKVTQRAAGKVTFNEETGKYQVIE